LVSYQAGKSVIFTSLIAKITAYFLRLITKIQFQGLHETIEHAMMGLDIAHRNNHGRKEGHRVLEMCEAIMGIMVIEHLIVERIEILLYVLQLLKDTLIPNGIPGILVLSNYYKSPLLLIIPNGDPEVTAILPLIPEMDSGTVPKRLIIYLRIVFVRHPLQ
jgi:hypothetical protein